MDTTSLSVFAEKGPKVDTNIYRTNPKDATSEDGVYRSRVKLLLNPFNPQNSVVNQTNYWLASLDGSRLVRSALADGDRNCPIFKAWKRQWYSGDEQKKEASKKIFDRNESMWVLVQILEDENKPELVGQFKVMKLAKDIFEKLEARMKPSSASKAHPYPVMDYVIGLELNLEVQPGPDDPKAPERRQREISYTLSQFGEFAPVIKTDGTPLFDEAEIELIDEYVQAAKDSQTAKVAKKKEEAAKKLEELRPKLRPLYEKAVEYVKANCKSNTGDDLDVVKYCGFSPWDPETVEFVNKWIELVDAGYNPANVSYSVLSSPVANTPAPAPAPVAPQATNEEVEDDLPF